MNTSFPACCVRIKLSTPPSSFQNAQSVVRAFPVSSPRNVGETFSSLLYLCILAMFPKIYSATCFTYENHANAISDYQTPSERKILVRRCFGEIDRGGKFYFHPHLQFFSDRFNTLVELFSSPKGKNDFRSTP